jgi:uncharacterized protein GlcG (DUF336 family)
MDGLVEHRHPSLDQALELLAAVRAEAERRSLALAISVVDDGEDWGFNVTDPRIVVYAGGVPLFAEGALVGGLGASGGAAAQDEECVVAAARALGLAAD